MLSRLRSWTLPARPLAALSILLPSSCALCGGQARQAICDDCRMRFLASHGGRCTCCALAVSGSNTLCAACLRNPPSFDTTLAACDYAPPLDRLVLALKFGRRLELAPLLGTLLAETAGSLCHPDRPDLLVPVPLGARRLSGRGFNQALEIARPLARALDIPLSARLLMRMRETGAQSLLHPDERRANVAGAFALRENTDLRGLHIGVVDDVMTTGETLHAIAALLKRHGAARVTNFVFARTLPV